MKLLPYLDQALMLKGFGEEKTEQHKLVADINAKYLGCTCCTYTLNGVPYATQATLNERKGISNI